MRNLKILLIEDNPLDAQQILKAFKKHDMRLCENFHSFLKVDTTGLDAIICDYGLETFGGEEFTAVDVFLEMTKRGVKLPMILLTGVEQPELKNRMLKMGMAAYFTKGKIWKMPNLIEGIIERFWIIEEEASMCRLAIQKCKEEKIHPDQNE